jgi:hypothetical protein
VHPFSTAKPFKFTLMNSLSFVECNLRLKLVVLIEEGGDIDTSIALPGEIGFST